MSNIISEYFQNTDLLQNTLLPYFYEDKLLKLINKKFSKLNYEKYNTHPQPHGIINIYYKNSNIIHKKMTYINGKRDGVYDKLRKNGTLLRRCNYKDGIREGLLEFYYENGKLCLKSTYKNGKREGIHKFYYEDGLLWVKSTYKSGKLDGIQEEYTEYGKLYKIKIYKDGVLQK